MTPEQDNGPLGDVAFTAIGTEMTAWQKLVSNLSRWVIRFRQKYIPHLVYYGQELDVRVVFKENKLHPEASLEWALAQLNGGHLSKIEKQLEEIGIYFDRGLGCEGRDWEWDWSLSGPISVKFRRPCKTKEKRQ